MNMNYAIHAFLALLFMTGSCAVTCSAAEGDISTQDPSVSAPRPSVPVPAGTTYVPTDPAKIEDKSDVCIDCHRRDTPGIFEEWASSAHARVDIGCDYCHGASQAHKDSFLHAGRFYIRLAVPPFVCARCHSDIVKEHLQSNHANALLNLEKINDNHPGYALIEPYREDGFSKCQGCHGSRIQLGEDRRPTAKTWPNSGAGRINQDKGHGNCAVCHGRHRFSSASARRPEACLRCHDGRGYPEGSIYLRSGHGLTYADEDSRRALDRPGYYCDARQFSAPTCALCHLNGAAKGLNTTHDPALRLDRDLTHPNAPAEEDGDIRRGRMKAVCLQCHGSTAINGYFADADRKLEIFKEEVVEPGLSKYQKALKKATGSKREDLLKEYAAFLAGAKKYRLNLYMGDHGRLER